VNDKDKRNHRAIWPTALAGVVRWWCEANGGRLEAAPDKGLRAICRWRGGGGCHGPPRGRMARRCYALR